MPDNEFCPICHAKVTQSERRPFGDSWCENGHRFSTSCILNTSEVEAVQIGEPEPYPVGSKVTKRNSDYYFPGIVVAIFKKLGGQKRYVIEDDRGTLFIQNEHALKARN